MKSIAVFSATGANAVNPSRLAVVPMSGKPIYVGMYKTKAPVFDVAAAKNNSRVLVRIHSFSCNYRDQNFIFASAGRPEAAHFIIGSEFAGEIVAIGSCVRDFSLGDRVISNAAYEGADSRGIKRWAVGVPSNHSSAEYQSFEEQQLMRMPDTMSFVEGAAFTIGAQTSYGMIRRLAPKVGSTALVTAGRSNTSLFLINALRARGVRVFALSSSRQHFERLRSLGVEEVFNPGMLTKKFAGKEPIVAVARKLGGFDHVFDPFFDIYMSRVLVLLAFGGSYISCGLYNQYQEAIGLEMPHVMSDYKEAILCALKNNLRIQGNRLGVKGDLRKALSDFEAGSLPLVIDSNYTGDEVGDFLLRTYVSADRFGKVIYSYS